MLGRCVETIAVLGVLTTCAPSATGPGSTSSDSGLIPPSAVLEGWSASEGPIEYAPGTLYEYLDGGAERYLGYGFQRLDHARYQLGNDLLASVVLDVYDMGSELGAFGIYRSVRPAGAADREWCVEGFRSGTVTSAWQGRIYVHCAADDDRPALMEMAERLVALVCEAVSGEAAMPSILAPLPQDGLVPWSERYVASDLLGHAFLTGGVLASYRIGGHDAELFYSDLGNVSASDEAMAGLRSYSLRRGDIVAEVSTIGDGGFRCTDPVLGSSTIVRVGRFVAGVHGDLDNQAQGSLLARLVAGLTDVRAPDFP